MPVTRILIVDDDARFRQRIRRLLSSEPQIEVVGEATDGHEAIIKARSLAPDLILMDVRMPGMNGISTTRQLRSEMPAVKIIMLSLYGLQEYRDATARDGADAYVIKKNLLDGLVPAIRSVMGVLSARSQPE